MGAIMTYGFYKYGVGVREHKYDFSPPVFCPGKIRVAEPIVARLHGRDTADTGYR